MPFVVFNNMVSARQSALDKESLLEMGTEKQIVQHRLLRWSLGYRCLYSMNKGLEMVSVT